MVYVYRTAPSESARVLVEALDGVRIRSREYFQRHRLRPMSKIVCWGERQAPLEGVRILNGGVLRNKREDAVHLQRENVPTIEIVLDSPRIVDRVAPLDNRVCLALGEALHDRSELALVNLETAMAALRAARLNPGPVHEWIPRLNHHVGGNDLMDPPAQPDYFVKKETFTKEFRVHSFLGKSIRSGVKLQTGETPTPSPWIRSFDAGWRIHYDGETIKQKHRDIAHRAVQALGLDFGAVDVGERADGSLCVLEVNRAPGLDGGTIDAYVRAIREWARGVGERERERERETPTPPLQ